MSSMNDTNDETVPVYKIMKAANKKLYMREYKANEYSQPEKKKKILHTNRLSYYRKKYGKISPQLIETYGSQTPNIIKIKYILNDIMTSDLDSNIKCYLKNNLCDILESI